MKKRIMIYLLITTMIGLFFYAFKIEPKRIVRQHYVLGKKNEQAPLRIVQLSDIHIKKDYSIEQLEKIVAKVNAEQPDIITFTGDLFDNYGNYGPSEAVLSALSKLSAPLGKFAVWGNHDYGGAASRVYPEILAAVGFQLLENAGTTISLSNQKSIYIAGLDDSLLGDASLSTALTERQGAYTILLTHEPDIAANLLDQNIQLVLAGHSHGGQIRIPFFSIKNTLAKNYDKGLYELANNTTLYVNSGLGTTKISARFRVPPEIAVFDLYL
ncbi:metallophosphoesterase [Erwinia sp. CPCC 100877]|nr:metallophosphoesterase [Erwinia sp. CPCC 100877]